MRTYGSLVAHFPEEFKAERSNLKAFQSTEADWLEKWSNGVTRTMQQDYDLLAHITELREGKYMPTFGGMHREPGRCCSTCSKQVWCPMLQALCANLVNFGFEHGEESAKNSHRCSCYRLIEIPYGDNR